MALRIPEDVGGDFIEESSIEGKSQKQVEPIENRAKKLLIPEDVGGDFVEVDNSENKKSIHKPDFPGSSVIEPAASIISSIASEPIAGVAGIVQAINPFASEGAGSRAVHSVSDALTFKPKTKSGKESLRKIAESTEFISKPIEKAEKFLGDLGFDIAGPAGGAIGKTIPTALMEAIGVKSLAKASSLPSSFSMIDESGNPTEILNDALKDSGMTFSDLSSNAISDLSKSSIRIPGDSLRKSRFDDLGIPSTLGDVTQDFKQQAKESRLLESSEDLTANQLRSIRLEQSEGITSALNKIIDDSGIPEEVGSSIKNALSKRKKILSKLKNRFYKKAISSSKEVSSVPVLTDRIVESIPDNDTLDDLSITAPSTVEKFKNAITRFGLDQSEDGIKRLQTIGVEPQILNLGNIERFRKTLNVISRSDEGQGLVMTSPVLKALDSEFEKIDKTLIDAGFGDGILSDFKKARAKVREIKTEFSQQSMVGKLIDLKKDRVTEVTEGSKVLNKLIGPSSSPENLDKVMDSLNKSGIKGKKAIGNLQAALVMKMLDESFKANSRKINSKKTIGAVPFVNSYKKLNDSGAIDKIFAGNESAKSQLKKISIALNDLIPPSGAIPKGSGSIILDSLTKAGLFSISSKIPVAGTLLQSIRMLSERGANRAELDKALKNNPRLKKSHDLIKENIPFLFAALIPGASIPSDGNDERFSSPDMILSETKDKQNGSK